ncbi:MAG: DEAD/DEAH box helicase family protein [Clostridium sp.]|nr:DEAD/DEAH box helicase family protein [Clostridium sp.]
MDNNKLFLYQQIENFKKFSELTSIPDYILDNLSPMFKMRDYQKDAFEYFLTYIENDKLSKNKQTHLLFHMATGAGKTYIMAGSIICLYNKGYRNFLFFVNTNNIIEKTKDNFLNTKSSKYLFNEYMVINGEKVSINIVDNFDDSIDDCINIKFTTIQQLHIDLNNHKENSLTVNDFEDRKIVLISDESHHVNSDTKKKLTNDEKEKNDSWEKSVTEIFRANKDNVMLEFTATCDLKNSNVNEKYRDKIVFDYPLLKFRESGYTKDFYNLQSNYNALHRTIQAMLLSQYRLKLFEKYGKTIKPVILLKSKDIASKKEFLTNFISYIKNELSEKDIELIRKNSDGVLKKMFDFFNEENISDEILVQELKVEFSEEHIISIDSGDKEKISEKLTLLNNLEDLNNPYRMVLTVNMLNEGWDVLNLFDIVRLYDDRQGNKGKHTINEAQLIGRGARYCPFKINDYDDMYKRKFDNDLGNELRVCETLYFHSKEDSKYIDELRRALREIGFESENEAIEFEYNVKEEFKTTDIYSKGKIFVNERVKKDKSNIKGLPSNINADRTVDFTTHKVKEASLVNTDTIKKEKQIYNITNLKIKDIDCRIVKKALRQFPIMRFNCLKSYFPNLKSINEFISSMDYAGKIELTIHTDSQDISNLDLYNGLVEVFDSLSSKISKIKDEYEGTKSFKEEELKKYVKDNKRHKINPDREGEGVSQNANTVNKEYRLDLSNEDWFVYNDNYGTTEEKRFVKYFSSKIEALREVYSEVYLIRNERNLSIYSFRDGARFEPDYILLLRKKVADDFEQQQIFIEPKGKHLRKEDEWKQQFMLDMEKQSKAVIYHEDGSDYKIIGLPFYTHDEGLEDFKMAFENIINK